MTDLLLVSAFIFVMAFAQYLATRSVVGKNGLLKYSVKANKKSFLPFCIAIAVLYLLTALRSPNVGNDTISYINIFNDIKENGKEAFADSRYEAGYLLLNLLVAKISADPQVLLAITSFIIYACNVFFILRNSKNLSLSLILFYFAVYGGAMNTIRQCIAASLVLIAIDRIIHKHTIRAYIWIILAFLFHKTALIAIVIPILPHIKFNAFWFCCGLLVALVLTFTNLLYSLCQMILPSYAHYFSSQYYESGQLAISYYIAEYLVIFIIAIAGIRRKKKVPVFERGSLVTKKKNNLASWLPYLAFVGMIVALKINLVNRLLTYFTLPSTIIIANTLPNYPKDRRIILTTCLVVVMFAYMIVSFVMRPEWNTIWPYAFYWEYVPN